MATHSSVLAWRIPETGEPGGLPSMGSHSLRHDWSNLAAAAASLVGSELEMRGYTKAPCEQGLLLCSGDAITLWGLRQVPSYWTRSPEGIVWAGIFPYKYVLSLLPASVPLPQRWTMLGKCGHSAWFGAQTVAVQLGSETWTVSSVLLV